MVIILEAHLAVGVGREIVKRHRTMIEKSTKATLHKRPFKGKELQLATSHSFMKQLKEQSAIENSMSKRIKSSETGSPTRTWRWLVSNRITLTEVINETLRGSNNRSFEDKTIQLWKHKLVYYKSGVVFSAGEIDLRDVVKIQMQRKTKIALILEIEEPIATKVVQPQKVKGVGSASNEPSGMDEKASCWCGVQVEGVEQRNSERKRKDLVKRAWVLDFSGNPHVARDWLSGLSANWKLAQQVLAVKISPHELTFPKSIIAKDLVRIARTGDLVLFKSKHPSGLIIRSWSGGDYDHIAMIYRFSNDVVLLEALGGGFIGGGKSEGIKIFAWKNFVVERWHDQYSSVILRRLVAPSKVTKRQVVIKFAKFLKTVIHDQTPKYSWHPMKAISTRASLPPSDPKRTYFCSELIAKAYKEAGLLRESVPTAAYYPSYFQKKKDLKLLRGFELSPDISINFNSNSELQHVAGVCSENVISSC